MASQGLKATLGAAGFPAWNSSERVARLGVAGPQFGRVRVPSHAQPSALGRPNLHGGNRLIGLAAPFNVELRPGGVRRNKAADGQRRERRFSVADVVTQHLHTDGLPELEESDTSGFSISPVFWVDKSSPTVAMLRLRFQPVIAVDISGSRISIGGGPQSARNGKYPGVARAGTRETEALWESTNRLVDSSVSQPRFRLRDNLQTRR